jgi:hypothetical protein
MILEDEEGDEVEKCCPDYGLQRCKYFCGYYSGNRVGGIMKAIDVIKD